MTNDQMTAAREKATGAVPAGRPARREILAFLRGHLHPAVNRTGKPVER